MSTQNVSPMVAVVANKFPVLANSTNSGYFVPHAQLPSLEPSSLDLARLANSGYFTPHTQLPTLQRLAFNVDSSGGGSGGTPPSTTGILWPLQSA